MKIKNSYEHKKTGAAKLLHTAAALLAAMVISLCCPFVSLADSTCTVTVESAKIRQSADTSSSAVGSVTRGATLTIKDEVNDSSGALWYQVDVGANTTGYIRADLVEKTGGSDNSAGADAAQGQEASGASSPAETAMDAQYAFVSVSAAKVRSAPSTNDSTVESLTKDAQMIVSGQSAGSSDGKVWYYVTFTGADGTEKSGFIRSDLITLGDMVPVSEEQAAPEEPAESEPQETFYQDYELDYRDGEWYLIDNLGGGYEQKLQQLLDANDLQSGSMDENAKKLVRQRIVIVVLAVLAIALLIAVIIMAVKLRDAYYEDYEDDEEEDDEEEEEDEAEDEDELPVRGRRLAEEERPLRRTGRETASRTEQGTDPRVRPAAKRKAKNFLLDDDDFEFEFLNMDDKNL